MLNPDQKHLFTGLQSVVNLEGFLANIGVFVGFIRRRTRTTAFVLGAVVHRHINFKISHIPGQDQHFGSVDGFLIHLNFQG